MLTLQGHRVTTQQTAEQALDAAGIDPPDVLILDLRMPVVSGLDVLRRLRRDARLRETPVAIVTGDCTLNAPVLDEMRSLGATVRYKPLWMDDLRALTDALLVRA